MVNVFPKDITFQTAILKGYFKHKNNHGDLCVYIITEDVITFTILSSFRCKNLFSKISNIDEMT